MSTPIGDSLAFFLPLYNEEVVLPELGPRTLRALAYTGLEHRLILVDDGSNDETPQLARQLVADYPGRVNTVTHRHNIGYGAALKTGFAAGIDSGADLIGFMDGDDQFDPLDMFRLLTEFADPAVDVAIGIRDGRQDKPHRLALGKAWKAVSKSVLDCSVADVDCGFKIFRREVLETVVPHLISQTGGAISPELLRRSQDAGAVITEVPVEHYPRTQGKSSGANPRVVYRSIQDLRRVRRELQTGLQAKPDLIKT